MTRQVHLNVNILNAGVFGGSWRFPGTDPVGSFGLDHYLNIARKAEAAKFDAVFLADGPAIREDVRYRPFNSLEPSVVLAAVAASTSRIGTGGIDVVDENCATSVPGLFAAGDAATRERICGGFTGGGSHNAAWAMSSGSWAGAGAAHHAWSTGRRGGTEVRGSGTVGLQPTGRSRLPASELVAAVQLQLLPWS
ncbi:hypothetical protein ABH922_001099 [Rhodococcus sp. 27YEA15]